MSNKSSVVCD